mgnify:CR=1 FL=1
MADKKSNYYRYLSDKDFDELEKYKHYAPKTNYELWLIEKTGYIERLLIPSIFTPNFITFVGNLAMFSCSALAIYYGGYSYHDKDTYLPAWLYIYSGFCVQWFSIWDCMDG